MTIDSQLNAMLQAYGADPSTLRRFIDSNLSPEDKYHAQILRFTEAVDDVFQAQNSLADWAAGHIQMSKAEQENLYAVERGKLTDKRAEFAGALQGLLEAYQASEVENGKF